MQFKIISNDNAKTMETNTNVKAKSSKSRNNVNISNIIPTLRTLIKNNTQNNLNPQITQNLINFMSKLKPKDFSDSNFKFNLKKNFTKILSKNKNLTQTTNLSKSKSLTKKYNTARKLFPLYLSSLISNPNSVEIILSTSILNKYMNSKNEHLKLIIYLLINNINVAENIKNRWIIKGIENADDLIYNINNSNNSNNLILQNLKHLEDSDSKFNFLKNLPISNFLDSEFNSNYLKDDYSKLILLNKINNYFLSSNVNNLDLDKIYNILIEVINNLNTNNTNVNNNIKEDIIFKVFNLFFKYLNYNTNINNKININNLINKNINKLSPFNLLLFLELNYKNLEINKKANKTSNNIIFLNIKIKNVINLFPNQLTKILKLKHNFLDSKTINKLYFNCNKNGKINLLTIFNTTNTIISNKIILDDINIKNTEIDILKIKKVRDFNILKLFMFKGDIEFVNSLKFIVINLENDINILKFFNLILDIIKKLDILNISDSKDLYSNSSSKDIISNQSSNSSSKDINIKDLKKKILINPKETSEFIFKLFISKSFNNSNKNIEKEEIINSLIILRKIIIKNNGSLFDIEYLDDLISKVTGFKNINITNINSSNNSENNKNSKNMLIRFNKEIELNNDNLNNNLKLNLNQQLTSYSDNLFIESNLNFNSLNNNIILTLTLINQSNYNISNFNINLISNSFKVTNTNKNNILNNINSKELKVVQFEIIKFKDLENHSIYIEITNTLNKSVKKNEIIYCNPIKINIFEFIKVKEVSNEIFRKEWKRMEWENKIILNSNITLFENNENLKNTENISNINNINLDEIIDSLFIEDSKNEELNIIEYKNEELNNKLKEIIKKLKKNFSISIFNQKNFIILNLCAVYFNTNNYNIYCNVMINKNKIKIQIRSESEMIVKVVSNYLKKKVFN